MDYIFETKNLRIRKFSSLDAERLFSNHLENEVKTWIPNESYEDLNETKGAIDFFVECVDKNELPFVLAIELKENGELIGDTGINQIMGNNKEVEIGFTISNKYSGKGYATEVLSGMTEYATKTFGVKTIFGRIIKGNNASIRVLEKNGYNFQKEEMGAEDDPYGKGMLVYSKDFYMS
jgi:ribosomal-protein-alanine N-acetyltransferase